MSKLMVGFSEISITPEQPVLLRGQFFRRISEYIESALMVNTIVIENGSTQFILCSCDLTGISRELTDLVRAKIKEKERQIDAEMIVLTATHTHTAPEYGVPTKHTGLHIATKYLPPGMYLDEEPVPPNVMSPEACQEFLAERIAQSVSAAWHSRCEALLAPQFGRAVVGHCRRIVYRDGTARMYGKADVPEFYALEGGNDSGIELLYVFNKQEKLLGVLVNVACPSQVVGHQRFISSDYWGKARAAVKSKLGEHVCIVGLCAPSGDQCPIDFIRRHNDIEESINKGTAEGTIELGNRVADLICKQLEHANRYLPENPIFTHQSETITLPLRRVSDDEYLASKAQFDDYVNSLNRNALTYKDMSALHVSAGTMERYELQKTESSFSFEVHAARIDEIGYACNPFELFLDFGNMIRVGSPARQTFLTQLSVSGQAGYLPTEKAERGGHYSAYVSSGKTGHAGGMLLVEQTLRMLRSMWQLEK